MFSIWPDLTPFLARIKPPPPLRASVSVPVVTLMPTYGNYRADSLAKVILFRNARKGHVIAAAKVFSVNPFYY
jgi:hypothetical protein